MFNFYDKKFLISITIIVLISTFISVIYQMFFIDSKIKNINKAVSNSFLIKKESKINETIFDITDEHDFVFLITENYKSSFYFGKNNENYIQHLKKFILLKETTVLKKRNDSIVLFINKLDTLKFSFNINKNGNFLDSGVIK
jgi:ribonucleotide reductase alpha subunit